MVTGAGGSIGGALSLRIADLHPRRLVLIDASEQALHRLQSSLAGSGLREKASIVLANVMDTMHLDEIFEAHRPQLIFHAAAYKHVPLLEEHPLEAIANNSLGTFRLTESAKKFGIRKVVLLSTDKAAAPISVLGASKRIAEQITIANDGVALRLANVLGTEGSVSETFLRQIDAGEPITLTDPSAERYFVTLEEAVDLLLASATVPEGAALLAPNLERQYRVAELAEYLVSFCLPGASLDFTVTGLRAGDKQREALWSGEEQPYVADKNGYFAIKPAAIEHLFLRHKMDALDSALRERDLAQAMEIVLQLVPDYAPSAGLLALIEKSSHRVTQR